jgi:hypothetical protein
MIASCRSLFSDSYDVSLPTCLTEWLLREANSAKELSGKGQ